MGDDHRIDDLALDERDDGLAHARQRRRRQRQHQIPAVQQHVAPQPSHPTWLGGGRRQHGVVGGGRPGRGRGRVHQSARRSAARCACQSSMAAPSQTNDSINRSGSGVRPQSSSRRRIISASTRASERLALRREMQNRHPLVPVDGRPDQEPPLRQGLDRGTHRRLPYGQPVGHPRSPLVTRGDGREHPVMRQAQLSRGPFEHPGRASESPHRLDPLCCRDRSHSAPAYQDGSVIEPSDGSGTTGAKLSALQLRFQWV